MFLTRTKNQTSQSKRSRFEQLLARYRAQVYQANYRTLQQDQASIEETIRSRLDKPTVLVIEDNTDEWFLIRFGLLRQFPGAECVGLSKPAEVVSYLDQYAQGEKELPRLIVLDLYLPDAQRGLRVLQGLKSHELYQKIPVVVFSRSTNPADIAQVFSYSANSYVVKPTTSAEWQTIFAEFGTYWLGAIPGQKPITKP